MGEIASMIAAVAFALLVIFLALPLWKLARMFDQMRTSVREVAASADVTVQEVNATVRDAHAQLGHVDTITASSARVAQDVSALSTLVSSSLARPFISLIALRRTVGDYCQGRKQRVGRHARTCAESVVTSPLSTPDAIVPTDKTVAKQSEQVRSDAAAAARL